MAKKLSDFVNDFYHEDEYCVKNRLLKQEIISSIEMDNLPITVSNIFKGGKNIKECSCYKCKKTYESTESERFGYSSYYKCPNCKNTSSYYSNYGKPCFRNSEYYTYIEEYNKEEKYAIARTFKLEFYESKNEKTFDINNDFTKSIPTISTSIISFKLGIRIYAKSYSHLQKFGTLKGSHYSCLYGDEFKDSKFIVNDQALELFKDFGIEYNDEINPIDSLIKYNTSVNKVKKNTTRKNPTEKKTVDELQDIVSPLQLSDETIQKLRNKYAILHEKTKDGMYKVKCRCSCGNIFDAKLDDLDELKCPDCDENLSGDIYQGDSNQHSRTYSSFEKIDESEDILIRIFEFSDSFDYLGNYKYEVKENKRIIVTKVNDNIVFQHYSLDKNLNWKKLNTRSFRLYESGYPNIPIINTKETFIEVIKSSHLKYAGVLEAYGLVESTLRPIANYSNILNEKSYLMTFFRHNYIEQIYKCKLYNMVSDIMAGNTNYLTINKGASNVYDILNVTKTTYKIAQKMNLDSYKLKKLIELWDSEQDLDENRFKRILEMGLDKVSYILIDIKKEHGIDYTRQMDYLVSCLDNQCIYYEESLQIWRDYLNMAKKLHYNLKDRTTKYPSSLKKEHDRAVFSYNAIKRELDANEFKERVQANKKYEYSDTNFSIVIPEVAEDVIQEGNSLHHCVATYVGRIKKGDSVICFIRRKYEEDTSFFTAEIVNDELTQVRGFANKLPDEDNLSEFITKWATNKKLKVSCKI